ncbi:hypothetical protein PC116_g3593 [Phytophthora cactorum]|uniref:Uncharacterized protein n=1 Tax=Phytophthora cactorum TaxID=29920 RepID=A0A8T1LGR5_9STRA|nr:hypothetical protein Pcac1_g13654 [Phytophthora cactorum]KAG2931948.1 hypothetical protein PC114_g1961 [Phytophthora cactorum]KAG2953833.1 hypothetical protein PC117_g1722 [Phytophthora cactorum]KAG3014464.1 hypothetical protein PC120_g12662 [Phytophthora cactorum]KAG3038639.1 hypothetical protein PC119_g2713 [Phytophthora cactorum]
MKKGDTFDNKEAFKLAIVEASVADNCEVVFPQNNKHRVKAIYKSQPCQYFVNAHINSADHVRVTSCDDNHSCVARFMSTTRGFWLTALAGSASRVCASVCPGDIFAKAKTSHGLRVTYQQAHRVLGVV